jgi:hypothetical protein
MSGGVWFGKKYYTIFSDIWKNGVYATRFAGFARCGVSDDDLPGCRTGCRI